MKRIGFLLFIGLGVLCSWGGTKTEASVIPMTIADLTVGADLVVKGVVVDKICRWTADGHMIESFFSVVPSETLKGTNSALVQICVPGGDLDGISIRNGEAPTFVVGEEVVVFGKRPIGDVLGQEPLETFGWFQGKYTLLDGMVREMKSTNYDTLRTQIMTHVGR